MARTQTPVVLRVSEATVEFGGLRAVSDVSLEARDGEIVGLIGPNGAGKTTLFEAISGFVPLTAGRTYYEQRDLSGLGPDKRARLGLGRTLQNVRLFPYLSVLDNVRIACHRHMKSSSIEHAFRPANREEKRILARAEEIIALFGLQQFAHRHSTELSYGTLRLLELACMVALEPNMLLLDEPSSGISQAETEALAGLLRRIKTQTEATILMIEHDMPLIMGLADWMYVLDAGELIAEGTPSQVQKNPKVISAYLGTASVSFNGANRRAGQPLLELDGVDVYYDKIQVLDSVSLTVRSHESVALLGTNGAGKSTILKTASGLLQLSRGRVIWKGSDITDVAASGRLQLGIGQVPGGRALFPTLTVAENLRMGGFIYDSDSKITEEYKRVARYFPWIEERATQVAATLSGGEQQQLAIARALIARPELLMIDELSLGLAPVVINRLMETITQIQKEEGLTLVIVEQQASFALQYTDRAYFLEKGRLRFDGRSEDLAGRKDLLRSVFLAGATSELRP